MRNILFLVPARANSKGIPNKNLKLLSGKPLILHTIDELKKICPIENIVVSTDSDRIIEVAINAGLNVPFKRISSLAKDDTGQHEVIINAIEELEKLNRNYEKVVLLQPTSPLRKSKHIIEALEIFNDDVDMVASVKIAKDNPHFNLFLLQNDLLKRYIEYNGIKRRQDCPKAYSYNGAIYISTVKKLKNKKLHELDKIRPYIMNEIDSIDIDNNLDWDIAEIILSRKNLIKKCV